MHNPYAYVKGPEYGTVRRTDDSGKVGSHHVSAVRLLLTRLRAQPVINYELSRQYPNTWKAMAELQQLGKTRMVGKTLTQHQPRSSISPE